MVIAWYSVLSILPIRDNGNFMAWADTIVNPKQAGTCGAGIRNEHHVKSLICTYIKCYRTFSIYSLSRL